MLCTDTKPVPHQMDVLPENHLPRSKPHAQSRRKWAIASLNSVAKFRMNIVFFDGISNTFSLFLKDWGKHPKFEIKTSLHFWMASFTKGGHHLNVNVLNRKTLQDAMKHPEKYPQLTIRVSGYAVRFVRLTKKNNKKKLSLVPSMSDSNARAHRPPNLAPPQGAGQKVRNTSACVLKTHESHEKIGRIHSIESFGTSMVLAFDLLFLAGCYPDVSLPQYWWVL